MIKSVDFKKLIILWILLLSVLYSLLSILRHDHFQSGGFDLGLFDQTVWQYSRFLYPYNTIKDRFILGDHFTPILTLLSPLYWLWSNVRLLLIFQAFWISFSTFAIFKIAKLKKMSSFTAFAVSFSYSIFYGIQQAVFFDFHPVVIGVGLLSWLAYFWLADKKKLFYATLVLLFLTQENMGIGLACLSLIFFFEKNQQKKALTMFISGIAISLIEAKIISRFSPVGFQYQPEINLNLIKIATDLFNSEEKRQVWLYSLSWFSFLPLLSPGSLMAVIADLAQYFVTGPEFQRMWSPFMHHRITLSLFLILGVIQVLNYRFFKKWRFWLSLIILSTSIFCQYYFHFPLNKLSKSIYWKKEFWMDDNKEMFSQISSDVSIATQQNLVPHLSQRKEIYLIWPRMHKVDNFCENCWWLDFAGKPEYLLVDLRPNQWLTQLLESNENFKQAVNNMKKAGKIEFNRKINNIYLYNINY